MCQWLYLKCKSTGLAVQGAGIKKKNPLGAGGNAPRGKRGVVMLMTIFIIGQLVPRHKVPRKKIINYVLLLTKGALGEPAWITPLAIKQPLALRL
jgi:hypothetical protein